MESEWINLAASLKTRWLGQPTIYHASVGSTNDELKQMVAAGTAVSPSAGTVILADYQTQGRGRFDRRWEAQPGSSLLFSALFRPNWPGERTNWLTMLACLAVAKTVTAHTGLDARIKWPNDIVLNVDGVWHKVCGLLLEGNLADDGRCQSAILGIGLNVNISPAELPSAPTPPTSLLAATGQMISRRELFIELLSCLETHYEAAVNGRSPQPAWEQHLVTLGQPVTVSYSGAGTFGPTETEVVGTAVGTDEWGHLFVRDTAGQLRRIVAADVTLRPSKHAESFDNSAD